MSAIVAPVASGGGGGSGSALASNQRGSTTGLAPSAVATLVSFTAGASRLRGFNVHGTTDGLAWVDVDSVALSGIAARFSRALPAYLVLPNSEIYASPTSVVRLRVRNDGSTAGDFEGTLFNEVG